MGKSNSYYMQLHVEALFTMNEKNELMTIREPWDSTSQPAPRFYLTRPLYEKPHAYFRADVPKELREKLQSITNREPVLMLPNESPIYDKEYRQLLGESKISEDACFWLPEQPKLKACLLTKDNIEPQMSHYFPWLPEELLDVPFCAAYLEDSQVVSITFDSYIPRLQNCSHMVSTNSTFVFLSNFERSTARFIVSSLLALKTI